MKPIIGIIVRPGKSEVGHDTLCVYKNVSEAVIKHGGIPLGILPTNIDNFYNNNIYNTKFMDSFEIDDYKKIINLCDGLICQGGDDFYDYDLKAIKYAYYNNIPLLGICLGMQTMAYLFNGKLKDMHNDFHQQKDKDYVHTVRLDLNSKLSQILGKEYICVNSRHNSVVTETDLDVVGYSQDGIIEAVEDASKKFFIGVQWHPESMIEYDILTNRLFAYFIQSCK